MAEEIRNGAEEIELEENGAEEEGENIAAAFDEDEESEDIEIEDEEDDGGESDGDQEGDPALEPEDGEENKNTDGDGEEEKGGDGDAKKDTDGNAEIERLKREIEEKDRVIEKRNKAIRYLGYSVADADELAERDVAVGDEESRMRDYVAGKLKADYDMVTAAYPWAENEQKSVEGFGEKYLEFMRYNEHRMTALDAFRIANADAIAQHEKESAAQADVRAIERRAVRNMKNKEHQKGVGGAGGGKPVTIPRETYNMYKAINPGVTDREIVRHYTKTHQK